MKKILVMKEWQDIYGNYQTGIYVTDEGIELLKECLQDRINQEPSEPSDSVRCLKCGCIISDAEHNDNHGLCNNCEEDS